VEVERPFRPARLTQRPELIPIDPAHAAAQLPEATDPAQHQLVRALRQGDEAGTRELVDEGTGERDAAAAQQGRQAPQSQEDRGQRNVAPAQLARRGDHALGRGVDRDRVELADVVAREVCVEAHPP
jgi:hypothetical protein